MNNHSFQRVPSLSKDRLIKKVGFWRRFFGFLDSDVEIIPSSHQTEANAIANSEASIESLKKVPTDDSLVDIKKLQQMAFRRQVLDWRDTFHANTITTITRLHQEFIRQTMSDLDNTHLFRKVLARPSSEVLQDNFTFLVRRPLIFALRKEEMNFANCSQQWSLPKKVELCFDIRSLNAECASLDDVSFKPSNKELILLRIQTLMFGTDGMAENFCEQGVQFSRNLLNMKEIL
jgi:hypothetical protein